jgi:RHS repeat-associated protein
MRALFAAVVVAFACCCASPALAASPFDPPDTAVREFSGARTPQSRTWELRDGDVVTQTAGGPVQWQDDAGRWHDYDLGLNQHGAQGWSAKAGQAEISFPKSIGGPQNAPVQIADGDGDVLRAEFLGAAQTAATVDGQAVTYPGVLDGVDVRLRAVPEGLKEDVLLRSPASKRDYAFRLSVDMPLATVTTDSDGGLVVWGQNGAAFVIPAPVSTDALGAFSPNSRWGVRKVGGRAWKVWPVLDDAWLDEPDRVWPVAVDPTVNVLASNPTQDCQVSIVDYAGSDVCNVGEYRLVGGKWRDPSRPSPFQTGSVGLMYFASPTLVQGDAIESAALKLYRLDSQTPDMSNVYVARNRGTVFNASLDADFESAARIPPGPAGPINLDLTDFVDNWTKWTVSEGRDGYPNSGLMLGHEDRRQIMDLFNCNVPIATSVCDWTKLASSQNSDPAKRPVLEVRSVHMAPAGSEVVSPYEGELTGRRVTLIATAAQTSVTTARFQYVAGSDRHWRDIPASALHTPEKGAVASADIPVTGSVGNRRSEPVVWDLQGTDGGDVDGPVHVRALLESSVFGDGGATRPVNFRLDRRGIDGAASVPVGPGELNLLSGEFTLSQTDAVFPGFLQDLSVSRTARSRGVAVRNADMFGPEWEGNVVSDGGELPYKNVYDYSDVREEVVEQHALDPDSWNWENFFSSITCTGEDDGVVCDFDTGALDADIETIDETRRWNYHYAVVETSDGSKLTFTQVTDPDGRVTGWQPDDDHPGYRLCDDRTCDASTGTTGVGQFILTEPGGAVATFASETANSPNHRITSYRQPGSRSALSYDYEPAGNRQRLLRVSAPVPTGGVARSLSFVWSNVGDPARSRVTQVNAEDGHGYATAVAQYAYDRAARLVRAWDPRISPALVTEYSYDADGRISEIKPAGEAAWRLGYGRVAGDGLGRLMSVSRDHPDGGTATTTIRYDVPVQGPDAPYDLGLAETSKWGQDEDLPWDAVAIFPPGETPSATDPDYSKATIHYLDLDSHEVNTATPGGAITTTSHDANGNVIRELTAVNRERALAAGSGSADLAERLSARSDYAENGVDLSWTLEPQTQIGLADGSTVSGRRLRTFHYDEGAPAGGPYHLMTTEFRAIVPASGGDAVDVKRVLVNTYDGGGWSAHIATRTMRDPDGKAISTQFGLHPDYPLVEWTRSMGGSSGGPDVQYMQYYGIAASSAVPTAIRDAACTAAPTTAAPSGFLCMRSEGTTPTASVPRRWYAYNALGLTTDLWESRTLTRTGAPARHMVTAYDPSGRVTSTSLTGDAGTAVPTLTHGYNTTTGREVSVSAPGRGTISSEFDANGRLRQYTDASGTVTRSTYDLRGRLVSSIEDGSRTITYDYDDNDDVISVTDPDMGGAMTATYDADGQILTESLPGDLTATYRYDESGRDQSLRWEKTAGCSSDCAWVSDEITARDADGKIVRTRSLDREQSFSYDSADRLISADDRRLSDDRCVRRSYAYDSKSNRTRRDVTAAAAGAACGTGTPDSRTWAYDFADRTTNTGWVYDAFGRATSVPAPDSGGRGTLTAAFYTNDLVRQLTLDGRTHTYDRDPIGRTTAITSTGGSLLDITATNHYADDSDEPAFVTHSDGSTERDIEGPSGLLVATKTGATLTYELRDLQGDIVATTTPTATRATAETSYDEFGTVTTPGPNVVDWAAGTSGYGWLGAHQRSTEYSQTDEGSGSPIQMGARVYLPSVGRFLQTDPVDGGSANAYDYANQDPLDSLDLNGLNATITRYKYEYKTWDELRNKRTRQVLMRIWVDMVVRFNGPHVDVAYSLNRVSGSGQISGNVNCREEHIVDNGCGTRPAGESSFTLNDSANYHIDWSYLGIAGRYAAVSELRRTPQFSCRPGRKGGACQFNGY